MLAYLLVGVGIFLIWKSQNQAKVLYTEDDDYRSHHMPGGRRLNHSGLQRNPSFSNTSQPDVKK